MIDPYTGVSVKKLKGIGLRAPNPSQVKRRALLREGKPYSGKEILNSIIIASMMKYYYMGSMEIYINNNSNYVGD